MGKSLRALNLSHGVTGMECTFDSSQHMQVGYVFIWCGRVISHDVRNTCSICNNSVELLFIYCFINLCFYGLFHDILSRASNDRMISESWIRKDTERSGSSLLCIIILAFPAERQETSVKIAALRAKFRNQDLPNTKQVRYALDHGSRLYFVAKISNFAYKIFVKEQGVLCLFRYSYWFRDNWKSSREILQKRQIFILLAITCKVSKYIGASRERFNDALQTAQVFRVEYEEVIMNVNWKGPSGIRSWSI
jgi:hypothetical protein